MISDKPDPALMALVGALARADARRDANQQVGKIAAAHVAVRNAPDSYQVIWTAANR